MFENRSGRARRKKFSAPFPMSTDLSISTNYGAYPSLPLSPHSVDGVSKFTT